MCILHWIDLTLRRKLLVKMVCGGNLNCASRGDVVQEHADIAGYGVGYHRIEPLTTVYSLSLPLKPSVQEDKWTVLTASHR
jgi:hypothetical protein